MGKTRCCRVGSAGVCGKLEGSFSLQGGNHCLIPESSSQAEVWTEGAKSSDFSKEVRMKLRNLSNLKHF